MIEHNVISAPRQGGKTYTIMHEIHDLIVAGRHSELLVVFPAISYLHWWQRMWESLFPHATMPRYVSINNTLKLRGLRLSKIYVEDIDTYNDGIYDQGFRDILPCLLSPFHDEEIIFTYSPLALNQRSHTTETTKAEVIMALYKRQQERRRAERLLDEIMLNQMLEYTKRGS